MRKVFILSLTIFALNAYGQDKYNQIHFNRLTEIEGTEHVIASMENRGKKFQIESKWLLFINTKTGETKQVDFPNDAVIGELRQIKIDSLKINLVIVAAKTVDLNEKKGIDWYDPTQIIILSPDGNEQTQLTDNKFFVRTWTVNKFAGTIVVSGHYDTNNNNKYDKNDKSEIHVYDLKTLKLISNL